MTTSSWSAWILATVMLVTAPLLASSTSTCSATDADRAEARVDSLHSWEAVAWFWSRYARCDQGSIAEGVSEAVARLLVDHWEWLPRLQQQLQRTPGLRGWLLGHIDSSLDDSDLRGIRDQAEHHCALTDTGLCRALRQAAEQTLQR